MVEEKILDLLSTEEECSFLRKVNTNVVSVTVHEHRERSENNTPSLTKMKTKPVENAIESQDRVFKNSKKTKRS